MAKKSTAAPRAQTLLVAWVIIGRLAARNLARRTH